MSIIAIVFLHVTVNDAKSRLNFWNRYQKCIFVFGLNALFHCRISFRDFRVFRSFILLAQFYLLSNAKRHILFSQK